MLNNIYYAVKPLLPRRFRVFLRRRRARIKRVACGNIWPIDERAGNTPPNWPGWPEGKSFAFVLTHDVEGTIGIERLPRLMSLEQKYGFRSSFNLVPEGEYRVSEGLLNAIDNAGFEVGVHGLRHDGRLYKSKAAFASSAARIREYLHRWKACGFRSPLMQHNLSWLHQVRADYDASTFDTDPFEPEPDGRATIFPFWVPGPDGNGYVELPYTLVQDFTLFVVLREKSIDIWKRKIDWIAARGGMVLLNTHPDYMRFEGAPTNYEFPISLYEELLSYVQEKYARAFWAALPRDVVEFYRCSLAEPSRNTRRKICLLTHSAYEADDRVRRYAETFAQRGDLVDVIAASAAQGSSVTEDLCGVRVHRVLGDQSKERRKRHYELLRFVLASSWLLTRRHHRMQYDLIHVRDETGVLVFAAWFPKWTGKPVILDTAGNNNCGTAFKALERISAGFAEHVIVADEPAYDKETFLGLVPGHKGSQSAKNVARAIILHRTREQADERIQVLLPGVFQWHASMDLGFRAFASARKKIPNAELHVYSGADGNAAADLGLLTNGLGLNGSVKFYARDSPDWMLDGIANADLSIVLKPEDVPGSMECSTRIMEFIARGIPVVAPKTRNESSSFDNRGVHFFTSANDEALSAAMLEVLENDELRQEMLAKSYECAERHNWNKEKSRYLQLVDRLCTETFGDSGPADLLK